MICEEAYTNAPGVVVNPVRPNTGERNRMMNKVLLMAAVMVATCASLAEDGSLDEELRKVLYRATQYIEGRDVYLLRANVRAARACDPLQGLRPGLGSRG